MTAPTDTDRQTAVACTYLSLADLLDALPEDAWDTPSLCAGWRVREVVAHMTMPVRYPPAQFIAELQAAGGDFTRLSNTIASRDAALPTRTLLTNLRDESLHAWMPPGGGSVGALNHAVIHSLDITVPLGVRRPVPDGTIRLILDDLVGGTHSHFGVDLEGLSLQATDIAWTYGSGTPTRATAEALALLLCGRHIYALD